MNNLPHLLAQPTPFGITVGQIAAVVVVAMIAVFALAIAIPFPRGKKRP